MSENLPTVKAPSGKLKAGISTAIKQAKSGGGLVRLTWDNLGQPISVVVSPDDTVASVQKKVGAALKKSGKK